MRIGQASDSIFIPELLAIVRVMFKTLKASCCSSFGQSRTSEHHTSAGSRIESQCAVERVRKRFGQSGLETLRDRPRPGKKPKLDAKAEARLIAEACSAAPEGRNRSRAGITG